MDNMKHPFYYAVSCGFAGIALGSWIASKIVPPEQPIYLVAVAVFLLVGVYAARKETKCKN